jgi:hypothetical protein
LHCGSNKTKCTDLRTTRGRSTRRRVAGPQRFWRALLLIRITRRGTQPAPYWAHRNRTSRPMAPRAGDSRSARGGSLLVGGGSAFAGCCATAPGHRDTAFPFGLKFGAPAVTADRHDNCIHLHDGECLQQPCARSHGFYRSCCFIVRSPKKGNEIQR